jgi:hypothetical protein
MLREIVADVGARTSPARHDIGATALAPLLSE